MQKFLKTGLVFLFCLVLITGCGIPKPETPVTSDGYTVTDHEGNTVYIPHKPKRIITAQLAFDTILLGIVPADHLVAVNVLSKDPMGSFIAGEVKNIRYTIPPGGQISTGLIMKTKPDLLILTDYIDKNTVEMIRSLGYPVVICHSPDSHQDIIDAIKLISQSVGYPEKGEKLINKMKSDLTEIEEKMKEIHTEPPVGLLVSQMQSYGGPGSMYDANLTFAHIRNGIEKAGLKNGEYLSKEMVLKSDPDFFLVAADRPVDTRKTNKYKREFLADPVVQTMKGRHNVVAVPSRYIYCGNQNCGWAIKALANAAYGPVYGELFDISDEHFIRADDL